VTLPRLLLEADLAGIKPLHFEPLETGGWKCSLDGDDDFSQVGPDGRAALRKLLRRFGVPIR
jgi:hypothetical protein